LKIDIAWAQHLSSTVHHLTSLPAKNSGFALKQMPWRALRCAGMVSEELKLKELPGKEES
jgi:hypothetical protein